MRAALIGPPQSGKSMLFSAIATAGGSHVDISRADQPHLAVVKVPDERLEWLSSQYKPKKTTPSTVHYVDYLGLTKGDLKQNPIECQVAAISRGEPEVRSSRSARVSSPMCSKSRSRSRRWPDSAFVLGVNMGSDSFSHSLSPAL